MQGMAYNCSGGLRPPPCARGMGSSAVIDRRLEFGHFLLDSAVIDRRYSGLAVTLFFQYAKQIL